MGVCASKRKQPIPLSKSIEEREFERKQQQIAAEEAAFNNTVKSFFNELQKHQNDVVNTDNPLQCTFVQRIILILIYTTDNQKGKLVWNKKFIDKIFTDECTDYTITDLQTDIDNLKKYFYIAKQLHIIREEFGRKPSIASCKQNSHFGSNHPCDRKRYWYLGYYDDGNSDPVSSIVRMLDEIHYIIYHFQWIRDIDHNKLTLSDADIDIDENEYNQINTILKDIFVDGICDIILLYYSDFMYRFAFRQPFAPSRYCGSYMDRNGKYFNPIYINIMTKHPKTLYLYTFTVCDWYIQGIYPDSVKKIECYGTQTPTVHGVNTNCNVNIHVLHHDSNYRDVDGGFLGCIDLYCFDNETDKNRYKKWPHNEWPKFKKGFNPQEVIYSVTKDMECTKTYCTHYAEKEHYYI